MWLPAADREWEKDMVWEPKRCSFFCFFGSVGFRISCREGHICIRYVTLHIHMNDDNIYQLLQSDLPSDSLNGGHQHALKRSQKWVPNEVTLKNTQVLCWEPILRIVWKMTFRWPISLYVYYICICIHVCEWMWWFESENWTETGMSLRAMLQKMRVAVRLHQILYLVHMNPFGCCRNPITDGNSRIDSCLWREPYYPSLLLQYLSSTQLVTPSPGAIKPKSGLDV